MTEELLKAGIGNLVVGTKQMILNPALGGLR